jgi:hypothetical protein
VCKLGFFWHEWTSLKRSYERVETTFFLFDEPLKGSKSLKIFETNLTFRFDKLRYLSKFVHTGKNSQVLTVSNKKVTFHLHPVFTRNRKMKKKSKNDSSNT